jgi:WD40 repeat protein
VVDLPGGREVQRFAAAGLEPGQLRWNPRRPLLALGVADSCRLLDLSTGAALARLSAPGGGAVWHPEGRVLAVANDEGKIYLWDVAGDRQVVPALEGHNTRRVVMQFSHAGDRLLSTDGSGTWRLWDTRTGRQLLSMPAAGAWLHFSPDDSLVGADTFSPRSRLFRYRSGQEFRTVLHSGGEEAGGYGDPRARAALHPDGRLLAVCARDGVGLVDLVRGEEAAAIRLPHAVPLRFTPSGALLTYGAVGLLRWPAVTDQRTGRRRYGPPVLLRDGTNNDEHGSSADTRVLAIPDTDNGAVVLHRTDGGPEMQQKADRTRTVGPQEDVRRCAVSPDGRWVATGTQGYRDGPGVKVWDADSGRHVRDVATGEGSGVLFSPDGKWLLTAGSSFRLWEVGTWREGPSLKEPGTRGGEAAFSQDGRLLALETSSGAIRLVKPQTGKEVARLTAPEALFLKPLCFAPDGGLLIALGRDSEALHFFDLRAIRDGLRELNLDWDDQGLGSGLRPAALPPPLEIEVDLREPQAAP